MEATQAQHRGLQAKAISEATVRIIRDYTGRGPTKARTYIDDDLVTVVLSDVLTKGERCLVEAGNRDHVIRQRLDFQAMMESELVAAVELQTDRKVAAFMSSNHVDPDVGIESFVLVPAK